MSLATLVSRLGGFALNVGVSSVAGLLAIPMVIAGAGAHPWAAVAVGQSIGGLAALLVSLGWGVAGPTRVAVMTPAERSLYYGQSLGSRGIALLAAIPACLAAGWLAAPTHGGTAALVAAASATYGLNAAWYFTGVGAPLALLRCETLPRAATSLLGAAGVLIGGPLLLVPASLVLGSAIAAAATWRVAARDGRVTLPSPAASLAGIRSSLPSLSVAASVTVYSSLPVLFVATLAPSGLPAFALVDRFKTFSLTALSPVVQVAQGYVVGGTSAATRQRTRRAFAAGIAVGALVTAAFPVAALLGARLLSGGDIEPGVALCLLLGLVVGIGVASSVTGLACLPALDDVRSVSISTAAGAVVFLVAVVPLTTWQHATGTASAAVLAEVGVLALLVWSFLRKQTSKVAS